MLLLNTPTVSEKIKHCLFILNINLCNVYLVLFFLITKKIKLFISATGLNICLSFFLLLPKALFLT